MKRALIFLVALAAACGSSGGPGAVTGTPTAPSSVTTTAALTGTTRQTSVNGCTGDSHPLTVADGSFAITLLETTDTAAALSVQVCPASGDNGVCTIKQQRINVGQTLTGSRVGGASQVVKMLPFKCVFTSELDTTPVTYKVTVTYQQ